MRNFSRVLLIAFITISSFTFIQQNTANAGTPVDNSYFDSVAFDCPSAINFAGQWDSGDYEGVYVGIYDSVSLSNLAGQHFSASTLGINTFSGSLNLSEPLPNSVIVVLWQGSDIVVTDNAPIKTFGLAEIYSPTNSVNKGLIGSPAPPPGVWEEEDSRLITIPECASISGCDAVFTIYGTALILDQQLGYSAPNGEPARDLQGNLIWVLHDVDQDGQDTYLIVDIQTGAEGETWLGIFIGACEPVYVPLNKVYPLNAIPVD